MAMDGLFLHPGELYAGRRPLRIRTILGSCVAITLWHPGTLMAAMCHYVLAARLREDPVPGPRDCDGRYGTDALQFLHSAALATDPEVVLMDEPASALDPASTQRIEDLIFELKKEFTIVIVTHNMQQAARVSDVTAFFYQGKLVETGPTEQIFTRPRGKQTEDYVTGRFG